MFSVVILIFFTILQDKGFGMRKNNRSKIFHHSMTNPRRRPMSNISTVSDEPRCVLIDCGVEFNEYLCVCVCVSVVCPSVYLQLCACICVCASVCVWCACVSVRACTCISRRKYWRIGLSPRIVGEIFLVNVDLDTKLVVNIGS